MKHSATPQVITSTTNHTHVEVLPSGIVILFCMRVHAVGPLGRELLQAWQAVAHVVARDEVLILM